MPTSQQVVESGRTKLKFMRRPVAPIRKKRTVELDIASILGPKPTVADLIAKLEMYYRSHKLLVKAGYDEYGDGSYYEFVLTSEEPESDAEFKVRYDAFLKRLEKYQKWYEENKVYADRREEAEKKRKETIRSKKIADLEEQKARIEKDLERLCDQK